MNPSSDEFLSFFNADVRLCLLFGVCDVSGTVVVAVVDEEVDLEAVALLRFVPRVGLGIV
jgi:hypothetical protein